MAIHPRVGWKSLFVICALAIAVVTCVMLGSTEAQAAVAGETFSLDGFTYRVLLPPVTVSIAGTLVKMPGLVALGDGTNPQPLAAGDIALPASIQYGADQLGADEYYLDEIAPQAFANCPVTGIRIPEGVKRIGAGAFYDCPLTYVQLPPGLTSIDGNWGQQGAFGNCTLLQTIDLPQSLTHLGNRVFMGCSSLDYISIPGGVEVIPAEAFAHTGLTHIDIGEGVRTIASCDHSYMGTFFGAFEGCTRLTSVTLPDSMEYVGRAAFRGCSNLTTVNLGAKVSTIDGGWYVDLATRYPDGAFTNCGKLQQLTLPRGLNEGDKPFVIGDAAFWGCSVLDGVELPLTLQSLGEGAFYNCQSLTNLALPESLQSIGAEAFAYCTRIARIRIPKNTTTIGLSAFNTCSSLSCIEVDSRNPNYCSIDGVLFEGTLYTSASVLIQYPIALAGRYEIPPSVKRIGPRAFQSAEHLTGVTIPEGVEVIGDEAFYGCAGLRGLTIPSSVQSIGRLAFRDCDALEAVDIKPGVKTIGEIAFGYCVNLRNVTLPDTLEYLGGGAFDSCVQLRSVTFESPWTTVDVILWGGSQLFWQTIPPGTLVRTLNGAKALDYALTWGNPYELIDVDPALQVSDNGAARKPIIVLLAGIVSDTGEYWDPDKEQYVKNTGGIWQYLSKRETAQSLGAEDVTVAPTTQGASKWSPQDKRGVVDSLGWLDDNTVRFAEWLHRPDVRDRIGDRPIIIVGHSYGGVIARSMLSANVLGSDDDMRKQIIGIVQMGSPNGGSNLAAISAVLFRPATGSTNRLLPLGSDVMAQLAPSTMFLWNLNPFHRLPVDIPVCRVAGEYLPNAMDRIGWSQPLTFAALKVVNAAHGGQPSDGAVTRDSLFTGGGQLFDSWDFGGGSCSSVAYCAHGSVIPGVGSAIGGMALKELIPQSPQDASLVTLHVAINEIMRASGARASAIGSLLRAASVAPAAEEPSSLPTRTLTFADGDPQQVYLRLDAPTWLSFVSAEGTPTVMVRDDRGVAVECTPTAMTDPVNGERRTLLQIETSVPATYALSIGLDSGVSGNVTMGGFSTGGARLHLNAESSLLAGHPTPLTAEFTDQHSNPLLSALVTGTAVVDGHQIDLVFADDGTGADVTASDGIYTARWQPDQPGRWLIRVNANGDTAERVESLSLDVGEETVEVDGSPAFATTPGPGETFASLELRVPIVASAEATYDVSSVLSDEAGRRIGILSASVHLSAGESTMAVPSMSRVTFADTGNHTLHASAIQVMRQTADGTILAGTGAGAISDRTYSASDFYAFSVTLDGPNPNPSPSHAVHFTGTAIDTSSTVAAVEYSTDAGATWANATADDGEFDSKFEEYSIDLSLPDGAYALYVRVAGADNALLPIAEWAGKRFIVDTCMPLPVVDAHSTISTETGVPMAHVAWLSADLQTDSVSRTHYMVKVDDSEPAPTYETNIDMPLSGAGEHLVTIQPIDEAGNIGQETTLSVVSNDGPVLPPVSTLTLDATANANGWYGSSVLASLSAECSPGDRDVSSFYRLESSLPRSYSQPFLLSDEGTTTLSYWSESPLGKAEAPRTLLLPIDLTPPSVAVNALASYSGVASIQAISSDALSGVEQTYMSLDGSSWVATKSLIVTAPGSHVIRARAVDRAGNEYFDSAAFIVRSSGGGADLGGGVDSVPPTDSAPTTGTIAGVVQGRDGRLGGVTVTLGDSFRTVTGPDGAYCLTDIPSGEYDLRFMKSGFDTRESSCSVIAGAVISNDVFLEYLPCSVSGVVTWHGNPLPNIDVSLDDSGTIFHTGISGEWTFSSLQPGTYNVGFLGRGYSARRLALTLVPGESRALSISLERVVAPATILKSPASNRVTYRRKLGKASYRLTVAVQGWRNRVAVRQPVVLQVSNDGKRWRTAARLTTDSTGRAGKSFTARTRQSLFYRWYVPAKADFNLARYSSSTRVTIR